MSKPTKGHKCLGVIRWVQVGCECGWRSDTLMQHEQGALYAQWRAHIKTCTEATE